MVNKSFKSEKGVTLLALTIYMIVLTAVLGMMTVLSNLFYNNVYTLQDTVENAGDFDTLNSCLITDAKANTSVRVDESSKTIVFGNDTTYTYNEEEETIYRGEFKVASHVKYFNVTSSTKTVDNVEKKILTIKIIIGDSTQNLINQTIDYTLKYW